MGTITTKRIYDEPGDADGERILVDRLWPRGISKDRARLTAWDKDVAPSTELPKTFRAIVDLGVQDGSIPTAYPEEAAQLLALLCNYWLMPCFYPASHDDMERRIRSLDAMLDAIDVPLFDEALIQRAVEGLMALVPDGQGSAA